MENFYDVEQSKGVLRRRFLPRVLLRIHRSIRRRRADERLQKATKPDPQVLQRSTILAEWPESSLNKLLDRSHLEFHPAGTIAAHRGEPGKTTHIYWVVSGKLTQVPTKQEVLRCSLDVFGPAAGLDKVIPTGPLIFPTLFHAPGDGVASLAGGDTLLSPEQEVVLDGLSNYTAAQLVDGDALVLGDSRQRCVRCQSDAVLLAIPLSALTTELSALRLAVRQASVTSARQAVTERLAKNAVKPSINAILDTNAVLQGLSLRAVKEVWAQLQPRVFAAGEVVCADVFTTDTIYFLGRGRVSLSVSARSDNSRRQVAHRHGAGVGLHSFAACVLPASFGDQGPAKAQTYAELWAAPLSAFTAACDVADELSATRRAKEILTQQQAVRHTNMNLVAALAQVPAFAVLSEPSLQSVAQSVRLRVHAPGKVMVSGTPTAPVREGFVVLSGQCRCIPVSQPGKRQDRERGTAPTWIRPGVASFLCEALLARPASVMVRAETCVVALHLSPGAIMDALEDLNEFDMHSVIDAANEYIINVYGRQAGLHDKTPQERAATRVREHVLQQRQHAASEEAAAAQVARSNVISASREDRDGVAETNEKVVENSVLTSLSLQIQSLHYDEATATRRRFFHDVTGNSVKVQEESQTRENRRQASERDLMPGKRPTGQFTLNDKGELIFEENASTSAAQAPLSVPPAPPAPGLLPIPPPQPQPLQSLERMATAEYLARAPPSTFMVQPHTLQAPFMMQHATGPRHPGTTARTRSVDRPPPRLAALRHAAEHLKNEADGFDPQAELRRAYRKARPAI